MIPEILLPVRSIQIASSLKKISTKVFVLLAGMKKIGKRESVKKERSRLRNLLAVTSRNYRSSESLSIVLVDNAV